VLGCTSYDFDPPEHPLHEYQEDEFGVGPGSSLIKQGRHAALMRTPFLCLDTETGRAERCLDGRPEDDLLSCDASGCHGDFDYSTDADRDRRHLRGSDGPSCYSCHDKVWSSRQD